MANAGYNEITRAYIDEHFGLGSFQNVLDEVDRYRQRQYQYYLQRKRVGGDSGGVIPEQQTALDESDPAE